MAQMTAREVNIGANTVTLLDNSDFIGQAKAFSLVRKVEWAAGHWAWVKENYPNLTRGQFFQNGEKGYVLIVTSLEIVDVYEINKLNQYVLVGLNKFGPSYDGRGTTIQERIALKKEISKVLGMGYKLFPAEEMVNNSINEKEAKRNREAFQANLKQREEEKRARLVAADKIRAAIIARPRLKGYSGNGDKFFNGAPIVGEEWQKMPDHSFCVEVTSYNDVTKTHGEIVNCFIIEKKGSRKEKIQISPFAFNRSEDTPAVKSTGELVYQGDDEDFHSVNVYRSREDIQRLQKAGLNSGTIVAMHIADDKFQLSKVTKEAITDIKSVIGVLA